MKADHRRNHSHSGLEADLKGTRKHEVDYFCLPLLTIAEVATGEAFQRLAEETLELPLLSTRILTIYELGWNALAYSMEVNALAIQHI